MYAVENAKHIGYYNSVLYYYFHNNESVTGGGFNRNLERFQKLVLAYKKYLKETNKFEKPAYQIAYKKNALLQFESMLSKYFANPDNPDGRAVKRQAMRLVLHTEPYAELLDYMDENGLGKYKRVLKKIMKSRNYTLIICLYKIKRYIQSIRQR
jgi:hypothetical protein